MKPILRSLGVLFIALILSASCSKAPAPEAKPKVSEIFKTTLVQYLKDGGKLASMIETGLNYGELRDEAATSNATFALLDETWPESLPEKARNAFRLSQKGYVLALQLWKLKIEDKNETPFIPQEPDKNGFKEFIDYTKGKINLVHYGDDPNRCILATDENIQTLITFASTYFTIGRSTVLEQLKKPE